MSQSKQAVERMTDEQIAEVLQICEGAPVYFDAQQSERLRTMLLPVVRELQSLRAAATAVMRGLDGENGPGLDECEALRALLGMEPV